MVQKRAALFLVIAAVFLFNCQNSSAQSKITIGLLGSPSFEAIEEGSASNNVYGQKTVVNYGLVTDLNLSRVFTLSLGIVSYNKGGQMSFIDSSNFDTGNIGISTLKSNYIGVPIIIDFNFWMKNNNKFKKMRVGKSGKGQVKPFIMGASFGVLVGYAYKHSFDHKIVDSQEEVNPNLLHLETLKVINGLGDAAPFYIGGTFGLKATVNFNETIGMYLRPNYSVQFNKYADSELLDARLHAASCDIGLLITVR